MFLAALFAIVKIWKQTKCPSMHEWINKTGYTQTHTNPTMEYYSAIKKRNLATYDIMGGP